MLAAALLTAAALLITGACWEGSTESKQKSPAPYVLRGDEGAVRE
jgi:hypothetical protein